MARKLWKLSLWLLTAVGALIVYKLAFLMPEATERIYSRGVYPVLTKIFGTLTAWAPFSIAEVLLYIFAATVLFFVVFTFFSLFKPRGKKLYHFFRRFLTLVIILCLIYFCFVFGWALNYARLPLSQTLDLPVRNSTTEELREVCEILVEQANTRREAVKEDANGVYTLGRSRDTICTMTDSIYQQNAPELLYVSVSTRVKPVATPNLLSITETTGIFSPFTYEPNINMQMPDLTFAACACHEYAHLQGFAREDEANFIAWLVAHDADDPDFAYSASVHALIYALNALHKASYDDWQEVYARLCPGIRRDFADYNDYWDQFDTEFSEKSNDIYNSYLQQNGVDDGRQSYGRMVDLILAMHRKGALA